jgi:hypothetical protein
VAESSDAWLVIIAVVAIAFVIFSFWRWYRSERQQSIRRLNRLRSAFQADELSPREVSYWLAALLKRQLCINHLAPGVALPFAAATEQSRWAAFMLRLHESRYAPNAGKDQDALSLLAEAKYWMRRWP